MLLFTYFFFVPRRCRVGVFALVVNLYVTERASEEPEGRSRGWHREGRAGQARGAKVWRGGAISFSAGCYLVE